MATTDRVDRWEMMSRDLAAHIDHKPVFGCGGTTVRFKWRARKLAIQTGKKGCCADQLKVRHMTGILCTMKIA
jgi:hypothetical protein